MKPQIFFFDIDGTLLSFKTHTIPASTVRTLQLLKQKGHFVYIATGRPRQFITTLGAIAHCIDGYITMNGAYCFAGETILSCKPIVQTDVEAQIADADRCNYAVIIVGEQNIAIHNKKPIVDRLFHKNFGVETLGEAVSTSCVLQQRIFQLTPFINEAHEQLLMPLIPSCQANRWHPEFVDINAVGIEKGEAILEVAAKLGIAPEDTIAFGDGGNDITMLQSAGCGIAMGNATDEVKAYADYVTDDVDHNGIENACARLFEIYA